MVLALTVTLPTAFALGIAARREVPTPRPAASGLFAAARRQSELWSRDDLWAKNAIHTRLLKIGPGAGQLAVQLVAMDRIVRPDVLVYWVPGERKIQDSLPDDAFLLGSFEQANQVSLALPDAATNQRGALVLYSLADQELVSVSKAFATQ